MPHSVGAAEEVAGHFRRPIRSRRSVGAVELNAVHLGSASISFHLSAMRTISRDPTLVAR
jgi:hypothetical protein